MTKKSESPAATAVRSVVAVLLALAVLAAPPRAQAADCSPPVASLYADARRAFEDKRYDDSVVALRRAYACDPNPVYLANIARSYEEANRPKDALAAWRAYLDVTTDAQERTRTEGRISALTKVVDDLERLQAKARAAEEAERQAELRASARPSTTASPDAATAVRTRPPAAAWILLGAGTLGIAAGGVLGATALTKHSSAQQQGTVVDAQSTQSEAVDFARAANVAFAVGGAVAAAGMTWLVIELLAPARAGAASRERLTLFAGPRALGLEGTFQ